MMHAGQLGQAIRNLRKEQGLTQRNLAKMAGVSTPWLSNVENGKASVEIGLVFQVLRALGRTLSIADEPVDILSLIPHSGNPSTDDLGQPLSGREPPPHAAKASPAGEGIQKCGQIVMKTNMPCLLSPSHQGRCRSVLRT